MITENIHNAKEELKRADHLLYVSLKYTRTVDVIKSIIHRLINAYDFTFRALLEDKKIKKKIGDIPENVGLRVNLIKEYYATDPIIQDNVEFFLLLRKIDRAEYTRAREFRRHVTMTAMVEGKPLAVNIDVIVEYFNKVKDFVEYIELK